MQHKEDGFMCYKIQNNLANIFTKELNMQSIQKIRMTLSMKGNKMSIWVWGRGVRKGGVVLNSKM